MVCYGQPNRNAQYSTLNVQFSNSQNGCPTVQRAKPNDGLAPLRIGQTQATLNIEGWALRIGHFMQSDYTPSPQ